MKSFNFLSKLSAFQPTEMPFISLYLNTEPNETNKKDFGVFLNKQLKDHATVLEERTKRRESFDRDAERIREYARDLDPAIRGAAVFACSGTADFFEAFEFDAGFEEDRFYVFDRPHIFPLVRMMERYTPFVVAAADTNAANIFIFERHRTVGKEAIQNVKTNRTEVGGWSQKRFQRHIENFHQQHAKEVISELEKIVRENRIENVILAGDETVIIPMLRAELSKELSEKVIAVLPLNVHTPENEIYTAAEKALFDADTRNDAESIEQLFNQNHENGRGIVGVEKTLKALLDGRVQELYVSSDPDAITYYSNEVTDILRNYAPGGVVLPDPGEPRLLIDEIIKLAADSAEEIRFIEDPTLLKAEGGIGALLRYQAKGVTNV